jgi:hypothetical protein
MLAVFTLLGVSFLMFIGVVFPQPLIGDPFFLYVCVFLFPTSYVGFFPLSSIWRYFWNLCIPFFGPQAPLGPLFFTFAFFSPASFLQVFSSHIWAPSPTETPCLIYFMLAPPPNPHRFYFLCVPPNPHWCPFFNLCFPFFRPKFHWDPLA